MSNLNKNQLNTSTGRPRISDVVPKRAPSSNVRGLEEQKKILGIDERESKRQTEKDAGIKISRSKTKSAQKISGSPVTSGFFAEFNPKRTVSEPVREKTSIISRIPWASFLSSKKYLYAGGGVIVIFVGGIIILNSASNVKVVITPRQIDINIEQTIRASGAKTGDVALDLINFEDSGTGSSETISVAKAETKSSGRVVVYNAFDTNPQQLIASTRLEAPNAKIYRIPSAITVPGAKIENGKIVPQGIEIEVVADRAGAEYNLGLSDFTIPGFKGSPKYNKFYARSKTEISGGLIGSGKIVTQDQINQLVAKAKQNFIQNFEDRAAKDLPQGTYLPEGASSVETSVENIDPPIGSKADSVNIKIKGKFTGLALKKSELFQFLAKIYAKPDPGDEISISNWESLGVELISKSISDKTLVLKVKGKAHFVWEFSDDLLISDLISSRANRKEAFSKYKAITRAEIIFSPPWWRIFPEDKEKIKIERVID